jgi:hypothetical protein
MIAVCALTLIPQLELYEHLSCRPHMDLWHSAGSVVGELAELANSAQLWWEESSHMRSKRGRPLGRIERRLQPDAIRSAALDRDTVLGLRRQLFRLCLRASCGLLLFLSLWSRDSANSTLVTPSWLDSPATLPAECHKSTCGLRDERSYNSSRGMRRVNTHMAIVGDTVVLIPYRYVIYSDIPRFCIIINLLVPRSEYVEVRCYHRRLSRCHLLILRQFVIVTNRNGTEIPRVDAECGIT